MDPTVDILIHNGPVVTMDADLSVIGDGFVGIDKDKIAIVGTRDTAKDLPVARQNIDAQGGMIMPGLINTHNHMPMTLFRGLADDLPLQAWLNEHMFPAEAEHVRPETVRFGTLLACAEMILSGTTTCCDGYFHEEEVAEAVRACGLRAVLGHGVVDFPAPGVPDPARNIDAAVDFVRNWQGRSPLIRPSIFCHSPYTCSAGTLEKAKAAAAENGVLFQIHIAETQSEYDQIRKDHGVTPVGYLDRLGLLDKDTLLVHAIWLDAADIEIIAARRAKVSVATESEMKLASGIAPLPDLLRAGIEVGLGTDGPASNNDLDLFQEMDFTAKLHKVNTLDPTVMDAATVVRMATAGGAAALGLGSRVGSLAPGKQADVIVVDTRTPRLVPIYNPLSHLVYAVTGSDVKDVVVAGRRLLQDRKLLTIDLAEIYSQVAAVSCRIKREPARARKKKKIKGEQWDEGQ